jgi:small ligand-binding sensory domain FIST
LGGRLEQAILEPMRSGSGLSTHPDSTLAARAAVEKALDELRGAEASLALVFASAHHAASAQAVVDAVHEVASPSSLVGCVAEGVVGGRREVEEEAALSVWLAHFSTGERIEAFHMEFHRTPAGGALAGWRFEDDADGAGAVYVMIADPLTFPVDLLLRHLEEHRPGITVVGGLAGGAGETVLFRDRSVHRSGCVGVRLPGAVAVHTLVSQGCRPIGPSYVITRSERNVLFELAGRPSLERLQETLAGLSPPDRELASRGLHLGRVIDEYKPEHGTGDFLIRGVMGADQDTGAIAVGDLVEVGQTVRFHVRDADTADEELSTLLGRTVAELPGRPAGALLFTCNGRGTRLFPSPNHDAGLLARYLGDVPVAGMFCAGELGPVGGRNFLHGFTASAVVFVEPRPSK